MTDSRDDDLTAAGWWTNERKEMGIAFAVLLFFGWLMYWFLGSDSTTEPAQVIAQATPDKTGETAAQPEVIPSKDKAPARNARTTGAPVATTAAAASASAATAVLAPVQTDATPKPEATPASVSEPSPQPQTVVAPKSEPEPKPKPESKVEPKPLPPPTPATDDRDEDGVTNALDQCPDRAGTAQNQGCPESQLSASVQATLRDAVSNVSFSTASAVLTDSSKDVLNEVAEILKSNEQFNLIISGHSDASGDAQKNLALSAERAKSCAVHIVAQGVDVSRIRAAGFGASSPRASNDTPEGRKRNRRVEFQLIER